jgi:three-Cys-motif partner protein
MKPDPQHYDGRAQAFVKHTFLSEYLPALCQKTSSRFDQFVYIDGFAGPWKASDTESYSDTSFGIALDAMGAARGFQKKTRGRDVKMTAFLVERDPAAFAELQKLAAKHSQLDVRPFAGRFEDHLDSMVAAVPKNAFLFSLIDPKGMKLDLHRLRGILERPNSEVLINFMYDFVSRFVDHPNEAINDNMKALIPHIEWEELNAGQKMASSSQAREKLIVDAFRMSVKREGHFKFVPSLTVQKTLADRTLYHLVFGTRSAVGLEVFRSSQVKALSAQADVRSKAKDQKRFQASGQHGLFGCAELLAGEFSTRAIDAGTKGGIEFAEQIIRNYPSGIKWKDLWPQVLDEFVTTTSKLGRAVNDLRKCGKISAPGWPSEHKLIPTEDQLLIGP